MFANYAIYFFAPVMMYALYSIMPPVDAQRATRMLVSLGITLVVMIWLPNYFWTIFGTIFLILIFLETTIVFKLSMWSLKAITIQTIVIKENILYHGGENAKVEILVEADSLAKQFLGYCMQDPTLWPEIEVSKDSAGGYVVLYTCGSVKALDEEIEIVMHRRYPIQ